MSLRALHHLFHHRWAMPVLTELHRSGGAKFVTLLKRLQVSRDSLQRTLEALVEAGWIMRNPGHGHPLRPEYILTDDGTPLAAASVPVLTEIKSQGLEEVALKKWSMPVLFAAGAIPLRFSELRDAVADATPRAVSLAIKDLLDAGLLEREVLHGFPPTTSYRTNVRGRRLVRHLEKVAAELAAHGAEPSVS